jgi:2-oxoisovalerate dehydrogenase E2 component (dihydrolipoyl transacylase)
VPDFLLPDLGEGLEEAEVIAWRVAPGDHVTVDQVIAEVETAKAVVEVPVPFAGVVARLHAEPGGIVSVGQPLVTVTANADAGLREPGAAVPEQGGPGEGGPGEGGPGADGGDGGSGEEVSGSVLIGYGTSAAPARSSRRGRRRGGAGGTGAVGSTGAAAEPTSAPAAARAAVPGRVGPIAVISPLARKEARDAGLDLTAITATGPDGVISRADIRHAIAASTGAEAGIRRIPLRGARRAAAERLSRSRREIPEATVWVDVDATGLVEARRALNAADPARPVSLLALLGRFTILGLRRFPELNARVEQDEIVVLERVNLGFAAQTEHGLVVPVVPDAHRLTTRELSVRLADRTAAARERRLAPAPHTGAPRWSGGTFTVNNYGVFGVDGSAAIINHPEVAILGLGRVIDRPWVRDGQLTVRKVAELTLAFDHRACDGGTAGGFLRYVADCIESPIAALGDL